MTEDGADEGGLSEVGSHASVQFRGGAAGPPLDSLPQDFGVTHRTAPATAGFVRLHLPLRHESDLLRPRSIRLVGSAGGSASASALPDVRTGEAAFMHRHARHSYVRVVPFREFGRERFGHHAVILITHERL